MEKNYSYIEVKIPDGWQPRHFDFVGGTLKIQLEEKKPIEFKTVEITPSPN